MSDYFKYPHYSQGNERKTQAQRIIDMLRTRSGFDRWWDEVGCAVRSQITETIQEIVDSKDALTPTPTSEALTANATALSTELHMKAYTEAMQP